MVASSVVLTVVVLNYHHRTADIHEMPQWVSVPRQPKRERVSYFGALYSFSDQVGVPAVATVDLGDESTRKKDHSQNDLDEQPHERTGTQGTVFKKFAGERTRHRRRLSERNRRRQQLVHDHESGERIHAAPNYYRGGGDAQLGHAARFTKYPARIAVYHEPHEKSRRRGGSDQRLEVRGYGGGPILSHHLHHVYHHRNGGRAAVGAPHNRPIGTAPKLMLFSIYTII